MVALKSIKRALLLTKKRRTLISFELCTLVEKSKIISMSIPPLYSSSYNDYRSDTFTIPTKDFWAQVTQASLGDTIYKEDTDTCLLEERLAVEFLGGKLYGGKKCEGLFCMSTTMSNQLAIRSHLNYAPPFSVLCDKRGHVFVDECAGLAVLSQALVIPVLASNGHHLTLEDIKENCVPNIGDIHLAPTKVISLENTLHGMCFPLDELERISEWAHSKNILIHMDGARLWNAASASDYDDKRDYMKKVCSLVDSVSICLSKSIGAPIGSALIGSSDFINRARHLQKQQGGGIRQAGFIAKIADYCIDLNFPSKLVEVNEATKKFWDELVAEMNDKYRRELILQHPIETNFIFVDLKKSKIALEVFLKAGEKNDVKLWDGRLAFHYQNIGDKGLLNLKKTFLDVAEHYKTHDYSEEENSSRFY